MSSVFPVRKIDEVCSLIVDCVNKTAPKVEGPTPWRMLRTPNIRNGRIDTENCFYVDEDTFAKWTRRATLQVGDTILTREAPVGEVGLVREAEGFFLGQRLMQYRADPEVMDGGFLHFAMRSPFLSGQFHAHGGTGSVVDHLRVPDCKEFLVPCPTLAEQREIAAVLGALDDKIELNRKTAATLEAIARALYRSWFVDFDPVHAKAEGRVPVHMPPTTAALFPDRFGDDGLPEGWTAEPFINQALWVNGAAYKNMHFSTGADALPVIKIAELKAGVTGNTKFTATDLGGRYRISRGELLFSWSGNPDTSIDAFVWPLGDAWLNQHIFAVRDNGRMSRAALFCALRYFKPEMAEIARNKQTTGLGHITRKDLEAFPVSVPPKPVEAAFEAQVGPLFERYCGCLYENQTLATLRDTLLPRLMAGDLRVGEARDEVEAVA